MRIKQITNIQTGVFAKPKGQGEIVYLQVKHFNEEGFLKTKLIQDLDLKDISRKHLLQNGDVLFASKGVKNFATVYEKHNEPAVASTSFFVLRLTTEKLLPDYLAWYLNSITVQSALKSQAIGTAIPSISKQVLENLEIAIPSIETQKAVMQITKLRNTEKSLKKEIETLREKQIQQQIINAIK